MKTGAVRHTRAWMDPGVQTCAHYSPSKWSLLVLLPTGHGLPFGLHLVLVTFALRAAFQLQLDLDPQGRPAGWGGGGEGRGGGLPLLQVPLLRQGLHFPLSGSVRAGARPR